MPAHVLVTGANGHVGFNVVQNLVSHGYRVRAAVRAAGDAERTRPLRELGAEIVEADILEPATLKAAVSGVEGVFQVAAVFRMWAADPEREIVEPSVTGGINVLQAACDAGVRKVVFTSSMAAVGQRRDASPEDPLTEEEWNAHPRNPYVLAKTRAEQRAWRFAESHQLDLVTINPSIVIGPGFHRHTPSTEAFGLLLENRLPAMPPLHASYVDARDVADLHRLAYESPAASGRYIAAAEFASASRLLELAARADPSLKLPRWILPGWMLRPIALGDGLSHLLFRTQRRLTNDMIDELTAGEQHCSSHKARKELGWRPRPLRDTIRDTFDWIRNRLPKE
jgi:dihydroflavonol-4-reductase